jgi:flagellar M-ring protein FliF
LTVEDLAFDENRASPPAAPLSRAFSAAERSPLLVKYAAMLLGIVVVMAFGVRPALQRAAAAVAVNRTAKELGGAGKPVLPPPEAAAPDLERIKAQQIFDEVAQHMKREPAQSSRLLQSWIHSD